MMEAVVVTEPLYQKVELALSVDRIGRLPGLRGAAL